MNRIQWIACAAWLVLLTACGTAPPAPPQPVLAFQRAERMAGEAYAAGNVRQAFADFNRAYAYAARLDDREALARTQLNRALVARRLLLWDEASAAYAEVELIADQLSDSRLHWRATLGRAGLFADQGVWNHAAALYSQLIGDPQLGELDSIRLQALVGRGGAWIGLAETDRAVRDIGMAEQLTKQIKGAEIPSALLAARARIVAATGQVDEAVSLVKTALEADRRRTDTIAVNDDLLLLAQLYLQGGGVSEARYLLQRVADNFVRSGESARAARVYATLAETGSEATQ